VSDFAEYARSLMVSGKGLYHDYRTRNFHDFSRNGAVVSDSTGIKWQSSRKGYSLQCEDGGLTVTDQASLRVTDVGLSIVVFGDLRNTGVSVADIVEKRSGATAMDWLLLVTSDSVRVYDTSATESQLDVAWSGSKAVAMSCANGNEPEIYLNGAYVDDGDSALTFSDAGRNCYIGYRGYAGDRNVPFPLDAVLIFPNKVLTSEEHAELYRRYMLAAAFPMDS
jgi:hypothetical protein